MSEDAINIDFGALRAKAAEMMEASEASRAATPDPAPEVPAAPAAVPANAPEGADPTKVRVKGATTSKPVADKATATPAEPIDPVDAPVEPEAPTPADLKDETLVKVLVDGEEVVMPWKDARAGISRTQKFTKSMQQLAKDREAVEAQQADIAQLAQLRADRENFNRFLANPQAVAAFLMQQFPNEFAEPVAPQGAPNANGDEVITRAEAQRLADQTATLRTNAAMQQLQGQLQAVDTRIAEATASLEHKQETAKHSAVIINTLTDIFAKNPVLNAIPNAEDLIRFEVAQMRPQTEAAALEAFRAVAQGMVEEIGKHYTNQKKVQAVVAAKTKLETKTIEPAGGAAPQITPVTFKNNDGTVNWNAVTRAARDAANG